MLNAAVIGLGWWGKHIISCLEDSDRINISMAMDISSNEGKDFASQSGLKFTDKFDEVLKSKDIAAVIIVTPHSLHEEQVIKAADAGKQIFCEKPFSLTSDSAKRMLSACQKHNLVVGIGHERRFEYGLIEMKKMVDEGEIGKLLHMEFNASYNLFAGSPASGWRQDPKQAPAGTMTALGIHQTDYIQTIGGPIKSVYARMAHRSDNYPTEDIIAIQFVFESGMLGSFCSLATTPFYTRMSVFGDKGWAELRDLDNVDKPTPTLLTWRGIDEEVHTRTYKKRNRETVIANFHEWADAVMKKGTYRFSQEQILHNVQILDAIVRSAASKEVVEIV